MRDPSPAGFLIRDRLARLKWSQDRLAKELDVTPKHVSRVIAGTSGILPYLAVRMERLTGLSAEAVLWAQMRDDIDRARSAQGAQP